jgi:hypothetical protein
LDPVRFPALDPFPFIEPAHPFHPHIERVKSQFTAHPFHEETMELITEGAAVHVRTSLHSRLLEREWELKEMYISVQFRGGVRRLPFHARTLYYSGRTGRIDWYEFPRDPALATLGSFFARHLCQQPGGETAADLDVLRYIPRQRLTVRTVAASDMVTPLIGKFVRPWQIEAIYDRLVMVSDAVQHLPSTFAVAGPRGIDARHGVFFQEARPGTLLPFLLNDENFRDLLAVVGVIHREIHCLNVPGVPAWDFEAFLRHLVTSFDWIAFFRPDRAAFLDDVRALMLKKVPRVNHRDYTFCHGDFSCGQILVGGNRWSLIDFDDCLRADPYLEISKLMSSLKYSVPLFRDRFLNPRQGEADLLEDGYQAYLRGYLAQERQSLDPKRLLWYRLFWEIHHLARSFKRDLFHPIAFDRTMDLVRGLSARLRREPGGDF